MKAIIDIIKREHKWVSEQKRIIEEYVGNLNIDTMDRLALLTEIVRLNKMEVSILKNINDNMNMEVPKHMGLEDMRQMLRWNIKILECVFAYDDIMQAIVEITIDESSKKPTHREELSYTA